MNHLVPCPECGRHVRVSERECPFCALPLALAGTPKPLLPSVRLSRAATLAFGATLASATALAACSSDGGGVVAFYGAPAFGGESGFSGGGASGANGGAGTAGTNLGEGGVPVYGAPDAGAGGSDIDGGPVPFYGAPSGGNAL